MPDSQPVDEFRTWLKQRIEAGEKVSLTTSSPRSAAAPAEPQSTRPAQVAQTGRPAQAAQTGRPAQAAQTGRPAQAARPGRATQPARPGRSTQPALEAPPSARIDELAFADGAQSGTPSADEPAQPPRRGAQPGDDSLDKIAAEVRACTGCRLHETRTKAVPGVGPADAGLVFVGEGPGADEDAKGEPFVGRAGQLLTRIIESVELKRSEVFITNIVKCRPPNNRDPRPDEVAACEPFLKRQLQVLQPGVICALGRHAAITLLHKQESMAKFRTGEHFYEGVRVFPTYHPAALLRNPQWKRPVWEDIQIIRREYDASRENR